MSFTKVKKGVCAAKGFVANGLNCGLNSDKNKNDLALVYSETQCQAAAVYTTNKVKGAPIQVTKAHLEASGHAAKAVIANSKNANTWPITPVDATITSFGSIESSAAASSHIL
jgi:glutamate N-acetyltransferase/amino-acid N-acetyltransferase